MLKSTMVKKPQETLFFFHFQFYVLYTLKSILIETGYILLNIAK